jgi:molybdate transport system ATP-binding protein
MSAERGAAAAEPILEARISLAVGERADRFTVEADLTLDKGVLVLFGPSGAGKSLTLQALAGLVKPGRGAIRVAGQVLFDSARKIDRPAHTRGIGYVPQHHSLFPFLSVFDNVAFGLPRAERRADNPQVKAILADLGLAALSAARPASLSGGERQRVALARALVVRPRLLLLDEPFASLDQDSRTVLRKLLRETLERHGTPAVFVTHDPDEALIIGDKLIRFERGRTTESGPPQLMLRRGHPVTVTGTPSGPPTQIPDGRAELHLEGATVTAPSDLLRPGEDGTVTLDLRSRPR